MQQQLTHSKKQKTIKTRRRGRGRRGKNILSSKKCAHFFSWCLRQGFIYLMKAYLWQQEWIVIHLQILVIKLKLQSTALNVCGRQPEVTARPVRASLSKNHGSKVHSGLHVLSVACGRSNQVSFYCIVFIKRLWVEMQVLGLIIPIIDTALHPFFCQRDCLFTKMFMAIGTFIETWCYIMDQWGMFLDGFCSLNQRDYYFHYNILGNYDNFTIFYHFKFNFIHLHSTSMSSSVNKYLYMHISYCVVHW